MEYYNVYTIQWCSTADARDGLGGIFHLVDKVLSFCKYYVCFTVTSTIVCIHTCYMCVQNLVVYGALQVHGCHGGVIYSMLLL